MKQLTEQKQELRELKMGEQLKKKDEEMGEQLKKKLILLRTHLNETVVGS